MQALDNDEFHKMFLPIIWLAHGTQLDWVNEELTHGKRQQFANMPPLSVHMIWSYWRDQERQSSRAQNPLLAETSVGRNDPCPCGSGKKFKKCCLH